MIKRTVIIGASNNPSRYSYLAAGMFSERDIPVIPIGIKTGILFGNTILNIKEKPKIEDVDTVTLYLGPQNQIEWYDYILSLKPKRIIFNPGTENSEFEKLAKEKGIETWEACTLVLMSTGQY